MTLNEIVSDIILIARGARVSQSEVISKRQVEYWVNSYRALLFKQSYEKHYEIDRAYVQPLNCLELTPVELSECPAILTTNKIISCTTELPKPLVTRKGNMFTFVGDIHGKPFQLTNEENIYYYSKRKYTGKDIYAFYRDNKIYVVHGKAMNKLTIKAVWEDPTKLMGYVNNCTNMDSYTIDDEYPISMNVIPILKEMILQKELKLTLSDFSDYENDGSPKVQPNTKQ